MSGSLRRKIGVSKRRINDCLENATKEKLSSDDEGLPTRQQLESETKEELDVTVFDIFEDFDKLQRNVDNLESYEQEWKQLRETDPTEVAVHQEYVERYGDYNKDLQKAHKVLEEMKVLYEFGLRRLQSLDADMADKLPRAAELADRSNSKESSKPVIPVIVKTETESYDKQMVQPKKEMESGLDASSRNTEIRGTTGRTDPVQETPERMVEPTPTSVQPPMVQMIPMQVGAPMQWRLSLPPIEMPKFHGDILAYYEFREEFDAIMDDMQADDRTRMKYLKASVHGEAAGWISGLTATHANYKVAINTLEEQYGGILRLQSILLQKFRELTDISDSTDPAVLQSFVTSATQIFNQLMATGCDMDNVATANSIEQKLPKRIIVRIYGGGNVTAPITTSYLLTKLREYSKNENLVSVICNKRNRNKQATTMATVHQHNHGKNHGQREQNDSSSGPRLCPFCADVRMKHSPESCRKYKTIEERKNRAREVRLCFKCLGTNHTAKKCKATCEDCRGNHHRATCFKREQQPANGSQGNGFFNQSQDVRQAAGWIPNQIGGQQQQQHQQHHHHQPFGQKSHGQGAPGFGQKSGFHQNQQRPYQQQQDQQNFHGNNGNRGNARAMVTMDEQRVEETTYAVQDEVAEQQEVGKETTELLEQPMGQSFEVMEDVVENLAEKESQCDNEIIMPRRLPVIMMAVELPILDSKGEEHMGTVFFDSGSNTSYLSAKFADQLGLEPKGERKLNVSTFGSQETKAMRAKMFNVSIKTKSTVATVELCEVPYIANNIVSTTIGPDILRELLVDQELCLTRERKEVDLLIGLDFFAQVLGHVKSTQLPNGLQLHLTECGPIVSGREHCLDIDGSKTFATMEATPNGGDEEMLKLLKQFWELESIGIHADNPKADAVSTANEFFAKTTTRKEDGRYVVRFPFIENEQKVETNRNLALFRLRANLNRLDKNPELKEKYGNIFKEQLELDFIERVPDERKTDGPTVHYLSHHPVIKESSKTTKVRIVLDGSAKLRKTDKSINDHLLPGENLLPDIAGVLLRVREKNILISADIQKAFLQMELHLEDRDATRFLWIDENGEIVCYRFKRVPFGLKSSPFLLNSTIKHHLQQYDHLFAKEMARSIYVDNVYVGVDTLEEACEFYDVSKKIFKDAQMNLCQYVSNCPETNQVFAEKEKCEPEDPQQKLLGVRWDTTTDEMVYKLPTPKPEMLTKRKALKIIASCYDPQGLMTPTTLSGKLYFQKLTEAKIGWDEPLSKELEQQWNKVVADWNGDEWRVKRKLFSETIWRESKSVQLHVFTDASQAAYGAVAYIRIITPNGVHTQLLMSKSRVAPLKPGYSIPQLEMLALLTGTRLANYIRREMDRQFDGIFLWSDSMCSLDSLKANGEAGSQFVKARVRKIREHSEDFEFSHVPGKQNPADLLTRGLKFGELKQCDIWRYGPKFLRSDQELPIRRSSAEEVSSTTLITNAEADKEIPIDVHRFSTFHRLLRTVMAMLFFLTRGKMNNQERSKTSRRMIYRWAQWIDPPKEESITSLRLEKNEDDIWIYKGRVAQRPLVFLPQGYIARLLIMDLHLKYRHASPLFVLAQLREAVWIPHGRSYSQKTIKGCLGCRQLNAVPYRQPVFANLPDTRIKAAKPFENCGVDFAGPLKVRLDGKITSIWFVLYTCLYTRYVHTEVVLDMETTTFLHTLRRMCAIFGIPKIIISDNATQFVMLNKVLEELKRQQRISMINTTSLPEFRHIPAHSPWAGGVYERMIGVIKRSLIRAGTTKTLMELNDFVTTLAECTSIVNCRPLSYVAAEEDISPLRPIDFVYPANRLKGIMDLSTPPDTENQSWDRKNLMEAWSHSSSITEDFQRRWNREYVQVLQERNQFEHDQKKSTVKVPKKGDVVLIEHPSLKKSIWPMGRIMEVNARSAKVKNGRTKKIVEYPWKSLFPLETDIGTSEDARNEEEVQPATTRRRSSRLLQQSGTLTLMLTLLAILATTSAETIEAQSGVSAVKEQRHGEVFGMNWTTWISGNIMDWTIITIAVLGTLYILQVCINTIQVLAMLTNFGRHILSGAWNGLCFMCQKCYTERRRQKVSDFATIIVIMGLLGYTSGCNEVASIQASEKVCTRIGESETCLLNTVSILNVRPNGSVACYRVRDEHRKLETFVEVQIESVVSHCLQKTHHFTRDFNIEHSWSHRCWNAGSCYEEMCEKLPANSTNLPEFSSAAKNSPGFSRCYRTCGCITCGRCFHCTPSCLFSRIYAVPKSSDIYEVLTCPAWTSTVEVRINFNGKRTKERIHHGVPHTIKDTNITVIITGFSTPPTPVHGATFIKKWKDTNQKEQFGFAYTSVSQSGTPIRGLIGEFQCATYKKAKDFKCLFDERLCQCFTQGTTLSCTCGHIDLEEVIKKTALPRTESGIQIIAENGAIITKTTSSAVVSIQVQFKNQSIERIVKDDECSVKDVSINGCFSCGRGMKLFAKCFSKENDRIEATVRCPTLGLDFLECSKEGKKGLIRYNTDKQLVDEGCTIQCGQKLTTFEVKGQLDEEATFIEESVKDTFAAFSEFVAFDGPIDFIVNTVKEVWNSLTSWIGKWIIIMVLVVATIVGLHCFLVGSFSWPGECRGRDSTKIKIKRSRKRRSTAPLR